TLQVCERVTRRKLRGKQLAGANAPAREEYRSSRLTPDGCRHVCAFLTGREKCGLINTLSRRGPCEKALELAKFFLSQARIQDLDCNLSPILHALCDDSDDECGRCVNHNQITLCAPITVGKDSG